MAKLDKIAADHDELEVAVPFSDDLVVSNALQNTGDSVALGVMSCKHGGTVIAEHDLAHGNKQTFGCDEAGSYSGESGTCRQVPGQDACPVKARYMEKDPRLASLLDFLNSTDEA